MSLKAMSHQQLLSLFADIGVELRRRGLCRSGNNPIADLAEILVARALHLELASNSTAGYDAKSTDGIRYQVKARRQVPGRRPPHFGAIRGLDLHNFDRLAAVLFDVDFSVVKAVVIPHEVVVQLAVFSKHQNGSVLALKEAWSSAHARDITGEVRAAWTELPAVLSSGS
jgi:hypothetical protein